jgi:predicted acetyltransferase
MTVILSRATADERGVLANLMQLYVYDWSEILPLDVAPDGRYADHSIDAYWQDEWRHPFLLRVDGALAGFAMVAGRSRLTGQAGTHDMAEFFVMRRYRRRGVGLAAARAAFDRFPGPWEIRQRPDAAAATAFWRRAVAQYTAGAYREVAWNDDAWTGPVQFFTA